MNSLGGGGPDVERADRSICARLGLYTRPMPQKPADRAKEKRRLTKRLAAWRAKQAAKPTKDDAPKTESK